MSCVFITVRSHLCEDRVTPAKTAMRVTRDDPQLQMGFFWVRVRQLAGGSKNDKAFMYYGNAEAADSVDSGGTYDKDQIVLYD